MRIGYKTVPTAQRRPSVRRRIAPVIALASLTFAIGGVAGAMANSSTEPADDVSMTPIVKVVTSGAAVAANSTYSFVASAGTTTVPSNADVVQLSVTVKGAKGGTIYVYPFGSGQRHTSPSITWAAGGSNSGVVNVRVGASNKVTLHNDSAGQATVGVKITGYSSQVTASNINGSGGSAGQVLRNRGDGTTYWGVNPTNLVSREATTVSNLSQHWMLAQALCNEGEIPVGGGYFLDGSTPSGNLRGSYPYGRAWNVMLDFPDVSQVRRVTVYATCAPQ